MASIYEDCALTICATASVNGNGGLFRQVNEFKAFSVSTTQGVQTGLGNVISCRRVVDHPGQIPMFRDRPYTHPLREEGGATKNTCYLHELCNLHLLRLFGSATKERPASVAA